MSIFKNKHLMVATLMAPILALVGYFGINAILSEKPQAAEAGQSYQLVEKPNCRRSGGKCGLKNADFELNLTAEWLTEGQLLISLKSAHTLDGILVELVENNAGQNEPVNMRPASTDGLSWSLNMADPDPDRHRLHMVASSGESLYYGDIAMTFIRLDSNSGYDAQN